MHTHLGTVVDGGRREHRHVDGGADAGVRPLAERGSPWAPAHKKHAPMAAPSEMAPQSTMAVSPA